MNKFLHFRKIALLLLLFAFNSSQAQISPDSIIVINNNCSIVLYNDIPVKEKMSLEKSWIANNFGDYKSVLQYEDENNNTIVIKGHLELYSSQIEVLTKRLQKMMGQATDKRNMFFTISFSNKKDRYRIMISDIVIKSLIVSLGMNSQSTYEEWTDQGFGKANANFEKTKNELDSLQSVDTSAMNSSELKNHNKKIAKIKENLQESEEKLEKKREKSNREKKWLNTVLANIFNSINNHILKTTNDDF